jgi:hypothetical protein
VVATFPGRAALFSIVLSNAATDGKRPRVIDASSATKASRGPV